MPLTPIPVPAFPNVPQAPGVPPLLRSIGAIQNRVVALAADVIQVLGMFLGPRWGIFSQGSAVIDFDSFVEISYKQDNRISTAPQEQGAFLSYNKVASPFDIRVTLTKGGTEYERSAFLSSIEAAEASLDLFSVVTPEITYDSVNIVYHDYTRRQHRGATLLVVDIWLQEVRIVAGPQFTSDTKQATSQDAANNGTVQAGTPSASQIPPAGGLT